MFEFVKSGSPNLGVEVNWSISDPDVDKETVTATITNTPTGLFVGQNSGEFLGSVDTDNLSDFGFLAILRATNEDAKAKYNGMQPYLGLGFVVSSLDINKVTIYQTNGTFIAETTGGDKATDVGFLLSAGLNYIISDHVKLYSEYKYQSVDYEFGALDAAGVTWKLTGEVSSVLFGASYGF